MLKYALVIREQTRGTKVCVVVEVFRVTAWNFILLSFRIFRCATLSDAAHLESYLTLHPNLIYEMSIRLLIIHKNLKNERKKNKET